MYSTAHWRRFVTANGLPAVSFHSLRHAHASTLIAKGVDILTISRRLGHSKATITLDVYGHLIEGADAAAAKSNRETIKMKTKQETVATVTMTTQTCGDRFESHLR